MAADEQNDLEQEEQEIRIQRLKRQAEELSGGRMISFESGNCSPAMEEQFWGQVVAFAQADRIRLFDVLIQAGICLPPPEELEAQRLSAKLWEVIDGLFLQGVYLEHTDHLSDRELYVQLWSEALREEMFLPAEESGFTYHLDLIGSGSAADTLTYLKYYASEEERREWAAEWPEDVLPEQEQPPYDRDRHLPRPGSRERFPMM